ncbi:pseudouridine synthase [uncultured Methylibium sp.]|uniref:pseudouridine synthase n=1 Tax=uncultured Methylibium sp. TaxID=381093 RepID=UPI0025E58C90|nr:pseudouridine synthase [uncultured Methylibium sp.]
MTTLKLKKKPAAAAPAGERRAPVRPGGVKRSHPTLAEAEAQRSERRAAAPPARSESREAPPPRRRPPAPGATAPRPGSRPVAAPRPAAAPKPAAAPVSIDERPRLSKRMSELGLASRREADEWIEQGLVRVDGIVVDQLGARVDPGQQISIDPRASEQQATRVTVLLHKPLGYVSGQAEDGHAPAFTLVTPANRWPGDRSEQRFHANQLRHLVPAGRLDLDSTGLLVLTQDGRVAKQLIGEDSKVEKEYVVRVAWVAHPDVKSLHTAFPAEQLARLRHGLHLDGERLKPAQVSWQNEQHLRIVLREGKKRQIRRMCELVGLQVLTLKRIRIGRIGLGELPPGQWRYLGPFESFS